MKTIVVWGKSKFCDYIFKYEPLFFILEHPNIKVKILYFTLEVSPNEKYREFLCHLLFRLDNIRISPTDLKSTNKEKPLNNDIIKLLESDKYKKYIEAYENMVTYIEDPKNPTGINKKCREYATEHGRINFKFVKMKNKMTGKMEDMKIIDPLNPYTPDDPEEYRFIVLDNASNLTLESGLNKKDTIDKMSKYAITLRNQLGFTFILIQHQAQAQEGIENIKLGKLKPSSGGLADCKTTTRDKVENLLYKIS